MNEGQTRRIHSDGCPSNQCGHCGHAREQHCGCGVECEQPASLADKGKATFELCPCPGFVSRAAVDRRKAEEPAPRAPDTSPAPAAHEAPTKSGKTGKRAKALASTHGNGAAPPASTR
jgi:hypothetical protein